MRIVIAPNSFKGSLEAAAVAEALAAGIAVVWPHAHIVCKPVADGGDGTVDAMVNATGGRFVVTKVAGPLGDPVQARWGVLGDGETAVVEVAAASGLALVPPERRNPLVATSRGTGELIRAALDAGCRRIIVGLGGSATNDGGAGMAQALGARLLDAAGNELPAGGAALAALDCIDWSGLDPRLREAEIIGATDVTNPLLGPTGASAMFGPQKGASPDDVDKLEAALARYADVLARQRGLNVQDVPGAGAAGGLGAGLLAFCGASLRSGAEVVLEAVGLEEAVREAALVVTGEGRLDRQTIFGKAPLAVARLAKRFAKPVIAVAGALGDGVEELYNMGIDAAIAIAPGPISLERSRREAPRLLRDAGERLARLVNIGMTVHAAGGGRVARGQAVDVGAGNGQTGNDAAPAKKGRS